MAKYDSGLDTAKHRFMVQFYMNGMIKELISHGENLNQSKMEDSDDCDKAFAELGMQLYVFNKGYTI